MIQCASVLVLLGGTSWAADNDLAQFRYMKNVERSQSREQEILAATLDPEVYEATRNGFPDLRVTCGGREIPFRTSKAVKQTTRERREPCASNVESLNERDDKSIEIVVRLDKQTPAANGLTVDTPLKDFERRIQVMGSVDGQQWRPLVEGAVLFDYSRYMDVSNRDISWQSTQDRWFKIIIDDVSDEQRSSLTQLTRQFQGEEERKRIEKTTIRERAMRIDRIELWRSVRESVEREDVVEGYTVTQFAVEQNEKERRTVVNITTQREPITALGVVASTANFSRNAKVESLTTVRGREQWREIGRGVLSSIRFRGFEKDKLFVDFPEQRTERYRMTIENLDNSPLAIEGISAKGHVYRAVFIAEPEADYRVYFGSDGSDKPDYDTATIGAALNEGFQPMVRALGPEEPNPAYDPAADIATRGLFDSRWLFISVVALLVVFLAVILVRAGRRVESSQ